MRITFHETNSGTKLLPVRCFLQTLKAPTFLLRQSGVSATRLRKSAGKGEDEGEGAEP